MEDDSPQTAVADLEALLASMTVGEPLEGGTEKFGLGRRRPEEPVSAREHNVGLEGDVEPRPGVVGKLVETLTTRIR